MGGLKIGQVVEAALWLALAAFLYARSFAFDKEIEIYKFGASAWPRAVLLLIVVAAIGQLVVHWKGQGARGVPDSGGAGGDSDAAAVTGAPPPRRAGIGFNRFHRHLSTCFLLSLPFAYMLLPAWIQEWFPALAASLHAVKLACAGMLIALYLAAARGNPVGAMLALPVFFGALMQDIGFYFLAPFFAAGVMVLMGERRAGRVALITALIIGLLLLLFVSVLYVGLPTGNLSPFYEFGAGLVTLLR